MSKKEGRTYNAVRKRGKPSYGAVAKLTLASMIGLSPLLSSTSVLTAHALPSASDISKDTLEVSDGGSHTYWLDFQVTNKIHIKKLELTDKLEPVFDIKNVHVYFEGEEITQAGTLSVNEDTESFLWIAKDPSLYLGQKISVQVEAILKEEQDLSPYLAEDNTLKIPNVAHMTYNDGGKPDEKVPSNKVFVSNPGIKSTAEKWVMKDGTRSKELKKVDERELFDYEMDFRIQNKYELEDVMLKDDLEDVLELKNVRVLVGGRDVTDEGTLKVDQTTSSYTWRANNPKKYAAKLMTVKLQASLKPSVNLAPYVKDSVVKIPNVGKSVLDLKLVPTEDNVSDEVNITTEGHKNDAKKFNVTEKGDLVTDMVSVDEGKDHEYALQYHVTNLQQIDKLELSDDLADVLDIKSVKVTKIGTDKKETDITADGGLTFDEDKETFSWIAHNPMDYVGLDLRVSVIGTLKEKEDLSVYLNAEDIVAIPNTGKMTLNDGTDPKDIYESNNVDITSPGTPNEALKYNGTGEDKTDKPVAVEIDKEHTYTMIHQINNAQRLKLVKLSDDLEDIYTMGDVKVFMGDADVTDTGTLERDEAKSSYTWTATNPHDYVGKILRVEVGATLKDDADLSPYMTKEGIASIPNKATMEVNADTVGSNEVQTENPGIDNAVTKWNGEGLLKTPDRQEIAVGVPHTYTLNYTISNKEHLTNIELSDDLEDVLDLNSVAVFHKGNNITLEGTLTLDEEKESFTWVPNDPTKYHGQHLEVQVTSTLKKITDLSPYMVGETVVIPNVAKLKVNEGNNHNDVTSNTIDVTTPGVNSDAEKFNISAAGGESKDTVMVKPEQAHTYSLKFRVPNTEKMETLAFEDDLEDVLNLEDVQVFMGDQNITDTGVLERDEEGEHFTWTPKEKVALYGQDIDIRVSATLKEYADLSAYVKQGDYFLIPNTGAMVVDGEPTLKTNQVDILAEQQVRPEKPVPPKPEKPVAPVVPPNITVNITNNNITNITEEGDEKGDNPSPPERPEVTPDESSTSATPSESTPNTQPSTPEKPSTFDKLIQTGSTGRTLLFTGLGTLLALAIAGYVVVLRRNRVEKPVEMKDSETKED